MVCVSHTLAECAKDNIDAQVSTCQKSGNVRIKSALHIVLHAHLEPAVSERNKLLIASVALLFVTQVGMCLMHHDQSSLKSSQTDVHISVFASMLIHVRFVNLSYPQRSQTHFSSATTTSNNWITVLEEERISGVTFAGLGFVTDSVITIIISTLLHRRKTEFAE
jgi:hypothetical protein